MDNNQQPQNNLGSRGWRSLLPSSLRGKFLVALATLAIAGIVINALYVTTTSRRITIDNAGQGVKNRVNDKALLVGRELNAQLSELLIVASNQAVVGRTQASSQTLSGLSGEAILAQRADQEAAWLAAAANENENEATNFLARIQEIDPDWSNLVVTDIEGGAVAMSPYQATFDFGETTWFQQAAAGQIVLGAPQESDLTDHPVLPLAVPIFDDAGQPLGVLRGLYRLSALTDLDLPGRGPNMMSGSAITLYFADGQRLNNDGDLSTDSGEISRASLPGLSEKIYETRWINSQLNLVAAAPVEDPGATHAELIAAADLYAVSQIPQNTVINSFLAQQRGQLFIGLLILLGAVAAAVSVSNLVSQPILELIKSAEALADGDFNSRAPVRGHDEIATLAVAFNKMADQVQFSVGELEMRVNERTAALNASNRVAQTLANSMHQEQIIDMIVHELQRNFDYYHVHIYLLDRQNNRLVMSGGSGKIGAQLLDQGHELALGDGLVGLAAAQGQPVLVENVQSNSEWVPNPLLPDTKSELAVPIVLAGEVVGVLDVQDDNVGGLNSDDQALLETIANQLAISLRNAQLFEAVHDQSTHQEKLNEINSRLRDAQSIEEVLRIASQEVATYLEIDSVSAEIKQPGVNEASVKGVD